MKSKQSSEKKTALITGASGGIGRAVAELLAQDQINLILHGNANRKRLESLAAKIVATHPDLNVHIVPGDLASQSGQDEVIENVSAIYPAPDILVLAAGLDLMSEEMKQQSFEERLSAILQVDVTASIRLARYFSRRMGEMRQNQNSGNSQSNMDQGVIVFFGWDGVESGMAGETAQIYATAKGAVQGFFRSLAQTVAPHVRVNCVAPGWVKTTWGKTASPEINERVAAESLAHRWGEAEEVAELVRFLVSDSASYINGQTICVNGGKA